MGKETGALSHLHPGEHVAGEPEETLGGPLDILAPDGGGGVGGHFAAARKEEEEKQEGQIKSRGGGDRWSSKTAPETRAGWLDASDGYELRPCSDG